MRLEIRLASDNSCARHRLKHVSWRARWIIFLRTLERRTALGRFMRNLTSWPMPFWLVLLRGVYTIESVEQMLQKNFRGGRFDVEPGGCIRKKNICRLAAVIFSGFSDKQIVRAKDSTWSWCYFGAIKGQIHGSECSILAWDSPFFSCWSRIPKALYSKW